MNFLKNNNPSLLTKIETVITIVAGIILLPDAVLKGMDALKKPGVLVFTSGVILIIVIIISVHILSSPLESTTRFQRLVSIILLALSSSVILISTGYYFGSRGQSEISSTSFSSLTIEQNYDFEDGGLLKDWNFVPDSKNYQLEISNNNDFSHSGTHSLRLMADFENAAVNPNTEYGGVGINKNFNSVDMIVAWVYIPKSEQVQGTKFKSHILVYVNGKDNQTIFTGQDRDVEPGMWTPLILGRTTSVEEDGLTQYQWDGTVDSLFISVWGNQHYKGSIYFDDITIYKEKDL